MSVNDITGLPVLEVTSDYKITMGAFNRNALVVSGSSVGIGVQNSGALYRLVSSGDTLFSGGTMTVRGRGTTSATTSFLVQNNSSTAGLTVFDNGNVSVGSATNSFYQLYGNGAWFNAGSIYTPILYTDTITPSAGGSNSFYTNANNFKIGTVSTANATAILQVDSTTRGFLQPRMTTVEKVAISTPATGLTVYDTTLNTNEYYDGSTWRSIASQAWVQSQGYLTGYTEGDTLQIVSDRGRVTTSLSSTGTTLVASATTGYTGVFFNYTLGNGTSYRAGTVTSVVSSGSTVEFTETSTNDIGNTSPVSLSVGVGGGFINLSATTTTTGWTIKVVPQGI